MWIKFDGKEDIVQIKAEAWNKSQRIKEFTIGMWVHICEVDGKLYINGSEINPQE